MQRLEVSSAVRHIEGSLGVRGLIPQPASRFSSGLFPTYFLTKIFVCIFNDSCASCLHLILHDLIV